MKKLILTFALVASTFSTSAQVGVGTIDPKAALDVVSTSSGLVVPRVTNTTNVTAPVDGMVIYDNASNCFKIYQSGAWTDCGFVTNSVLTQIGNEGDSPNTVPSVVTVAQINTISPAITGALVAKQSDYQRYIDANPTLFSAPATRAEVQAMVNAISATDVVTATGKIWMDRNLGATQVATSSTDINSYGTLYQWGRLTDGHQIRTSLTTATLSSGDVPGNANFITINSGNYDWRSTQNNSLWQGVNGINNPCPSGYRLPTEVELNNERLIFSSQNAAGAFTSVLKLPMAGNRDRTNGSPVNVGSYGYYWSSSVSGTNASGLYFHSSLASMLTFFRGPGLSVRCIKN